MEKIKFHTTIDQEGFQHTLKAFSMVIPEDSIALDIGAHAGYFSLIFGKCVGDSGKVIAFEPNPSIYNLLLDNLKNNNQNNVETYNLACTKENKKYIFNYTDPKIHHENTNGGYFDETKMGDSIKKIHTYPLEVTGVNIIDFLNKNYQNDLDKIKFIKIDTEGYDKEIIKTLTPILLSNKPIIMTEAFQALSVDEVEDFYNTLNSIGYLIYDTSPHNDVYSCVGPLDLEEFKYYLYNVMNGENFFCKLVSRT